MIDHAASGLNEGFDVCQANSNANISATLPPLYKIRSSTNGLDSSFDIRWTGSRSTAESC